jgi:hypothetical protein
MASKIEIRQRETGTLLGCFYTHLEPDDVRQHKHGQDRMALS